MQFLSYFLLCPKHTNISIIEKLAEFCGSWFPNKRIWRGSNMQT